MRAVWIFSLLTMPVDRIIEVFHVNWRTLTVFIQSLVATGKLPKIELLGQRLKSWKLSRLQLFKMAFEVPSVDVRIIFWAFGLKE